MKSHLPDSSASPFPGQRPYAESEARFFFGRDAEAGLVVQGLAKSRVTLLSGPAGVGKTSLLRAGAIPRLRSITSEPGQSQQSPIIIFWDNWQGAQSDPLNGLIDEIQRCCIESLPGFVEVRVPRVRALEHVIEYWAAKAPLFIIFDRFEDYLLSHGDEDGEGKFSVEFPRVVKRGDLAVNFLIAMRGGAHAKLGRLAQRLPQLFDRSLRLKPLSADAARAAIVLPIQAWNREHPELLPVHVDSTLVDYVIRSVTIASAGGPSGDEVVQVDAASLQGAMQELWDTQIGSGTPAAHGEASVLRGPALAAEVEPAPPLASIGALPDVGVMPDAGVLSAPDTAPVSAPRRWRSARSGRTFAALAFLFVCAFAVFGAAGWIGQIRDENDKQQALSVQEKADQALARARATLARAAQWQAANQQPAETKAPVMEGATGDEGAAPAPAADAVEPIDQLAVAPTDESVAKPAEERSSHEDSGPAPREPEVSAAVEADIEKPGRKSTVVERPRPSLAIAPDPALEAAAQAPAPSAAPTAAPPARSSSSPASVPAPAAAPAIPAAAPAVPAVGTGMAAPQAGEKTAANPAGSLAEQVPAWAKEEAVDSPPATSVEAAPVISAPVNSVEAAPAPVRAAAVERRRTTVDARQEKNAAKNIAPARAKDNPPRPGVRAQSYPSNNVIDAARAQSPSSGVLFRDPGKSSARSGNKPPVRTASYDRNAVRDSGSGEPPSIFIHVRDQSQLAQTMRLKRRLEANGVVVSGIKTVTRGPADADLRYFRRTEGSEARRMVNLLQSFNVPVEGPKYISGFESTATTRQYELWFPAVN